MFFQDGGKDKKDLHGTDESCRNITLQQYFTNFKNICKLSI